MRDRFWMFAPLALAVWTVAGCGGAPAGYCPAYGKVSYKGEPAVGAVLFFRPQNKPGVKDVVFPSATVGDDGRFTVRSPGGDGALPGTYTVLVSWPETSQAAAEESPAQPAGKKKGAGAGKPSAARRKNKLDPLTADRLKGRYLNPDKALLTADIQPGAADLGTFEIKE